MSLPSGQAWAEVGGGGETAKPKLRKAPQQPTEVGTQEPLLPGTSTQGPTVPLSQGFRLGPNWHPSGHEQCVCVRGVGGGGFKPSGDIPVSTCAVHTHAHGHALVHLCVHVNFSLLVTHIFLHKHAFTVCKQKVQAGKQ